MVSFYLLIVFLKFTNLGTLSDEDVKTFEIANEIVSNRYGWEILFKYLSNEFDIQLHSPYRQLKHDYKLRIDSSNATRR